MSRRVLVIGGTRNLGPDLVAALLARGDEVTVLNRGVTPGAVPEGVKRLKADRSNPAEFTAVLGTYTFDEVVDTTLYTGPEAAALVQVLTGRIGRLVFWSTGQVYLVRAGPKPPYRESDYVGPVMPEPAKDRKVDHDNWLYGIGKRDAEDVFARAQAAGFNYVSLRMPMINSARDHYGRLAGYVRRLLDGGPIVVPDDQDRLELRHVYGNDVIQATLMALTPAVPAGSCLNVAQDRSLSLEEMLGIVARELGVTPRLAKAPRTVLEDWGYLPACSAWSGRWMSVLDNTLGRKALAMKFTAPEQYLPQLIGAARAVPEDQVPGYARRAEEVALAGA